MPVYSWTRSAPEASFCRAAVTESIPPTPISTSLSPTIPRSRVSILLDGANSGRPDTPPASLASPGSEIPSRESVVFDTIMPSIPAAMTVSAIAANASSSRSGAILTRTGGCGGAAARARAAAPPHPPVLVKIAPDLDDDALAAIADTVIAAGIEGMIVSNTTLSRDGISDPGLASEAGGVSGRPLFAPSNKMLTRLRGMVGDKLVLIGVGGIDSVTAARQKLASGADLVQLYTGMVYAGPGLPGRIVRELARRADRQMPDQSCRGFARATSAHALPERRAARYTS